MALPGISWVSEKELCFFSIGQGLREKHSRPWPQAFTDSVKCVWFREGSMFLLFTLVFPRLGLVVNEYIRLSCKQHKCLFVCLFKCYLGMNRTTLLPYLGKSPLNYPILNARITQVYIL